MNKVPLPNRMDEVTVLDWPQQLKLGSHYLARDEWFVNVRLSSTSAVPPGQTQYHEP